MNSFMLVHMSFVTKTLVTIPTLEELLPCVSFCMLVQTSFGKEPLATVVACKRFLVRVSPFMCTEPTFSWKPLLQCLHWKACLSAGSVLLHFRFSSFNKKKLSQWLNSIGFATGSSCLSTVPIWLVHISPSSQSMCVCTDEGNATTFSSTVKVNSESNQH